MLYCRYRNGRLEAELPSGEIIGFEDMDELREFIEQRRGVSGLVGREEVAKFDESVVSSSSTAGGPPSPVLGKAVKIRIHKGVYTVVDGKLIKEKTA